MEPSNSKATRAVAILAALLMVACGSEDASLVFGPDSTDAMEEEPPEVTTPSESEEAETQAPRTADFDRDGVEDERDPTPHGSDANRVRGIHSGGSAKVVAITAIVNGVEDEHQVYGRDLEAGCEAYYEPQGALCEDDVLGVSRRTNAFAGPSFGNRRANTWGVMLIDACFDGSCEAVDFNEARVFQTFGYSKTTHVRLSVHSARGDDAPAWNDADWTVVADDEAVGEGEDTVRDGTVAGRPAVFVTGAHVARYIRVEVANDGSLGGDTRQIDFRGIKLFSASIPEVDADHRQVFVSSRVYDGNLGGLDGADEECQALADASLRVSGTFRAFLPHQDGGFARLEKSSASYDRPDGARLADGYKAFEDLDLGPTIDVDQNLIRVSPSKVWVGYGCSNFGSTDGMAGVSSTNTGTVVREIDYCNTGDKRIYCVEQQ
ncbi:MAG: hypothetical protein AAF997_07050 [Myxococcota bacterium]